MCVNKLSYVSMYWYVLQYMIRRVSQTPLIHTHMFDALLG